jgi:hypothetical protein
MTNKFRYWALMAFDWTLDPIYFLYYIFELQHKILHQIKPKNIKIGGSEKGSKTSYGSCPTEFVFEVKNEN